MHSGYITFIKTSPSGLHPSGFGFYKCDITLVPCYNLYIHTIVNRNIKESTGRIYGIYPRPQGSYTTAGKLYNHIKVRSRVQQGYMPYIHIYIYIHVHIYIYAIYTYIYIYIYTYIYIYIYHGFKGYMENIRPSHLDIGPRLRLGPISRCSGLIFSIYTEKPWYITTYNIFYS